MRIETYYQLPEHTKLHHLIQSVLLFIAYYLVSEFGYLFVFYPEPAAHFWPAAGLSLAYLLRVNRSNWTPYLIAIFLGEVSISLAHGIPLNVSLMWGLADTIEPFLAAYLICRILKEPLDLTNSKHLGVFLACGVLTPMAGALLAAFASVTWLEAPSYVSTLRTWWFAISLGEILVTPFILTWLSHQTRRFARSHLLEGIILFSLFFLVTFFTFSSRVEAPSEYLMKHLLMYLMLPLFLWTLVRFEEYGVFTGLLLVNMIAAYYTARGKGPFAFFLSTPLVRLVSLQTYLSFVSLATMALTAFMKQRKRSDFQLNAIIENSTALIYVKDLMGRYLLINRGYEDVMHVKRRDLIGRSDMDLFPKEFALRYQENDQLVLKEGKPIEFEESTDTKDYISIKFPLCDVNGVPYATCGISTEITAIKKAEAELKKAIALRDDFIAIASHELRTPLTPLKLQISLLRKYLAKTAPEYMQNDDLFKLIERSDKEIEQMVNLVENLLDVSRMTQNTLVLNKTECDLVQIINKSIERLKNELAKSNCKLEVDMPDHIFGHWDAFRLGQVFTNLLTNAMKYGECKPISLKAEKIGGRALIYIIDHGIGISPDNQKKIFERFERAVPVTAYGGLGLGLYIVQQLVNAHKGYVHVKSEEGQGSTFTVELPLRD